jgi:hypothetical protein
MVVLQGYNVEETEKWLDMMTKKFVANFLT